MVKNIGTARADTILTIFLIHSGAYIKGFKWIFTIKIAMINFKTSKPEIIFLPPTHEITIFNSLIHKS